MATIRDYVLPDPRTVPRNYYSRVPAIDPAVNKLVKDYIAQKGLKANQNDPTALHDITDYLRGQGIDAQTDYTDTNGHTGGILVNGRPYQLIDGSNNWTDLTPWAETAPGLTAPDLTSAPLAPGSQQPSTLSSLYVDPTGRLLTPNTIGGMLAPREQRQY